MLLLRCALTGIIFQSGNICILQVIIHKLYQGAPHYYPGKPFNDGVDGLDLSDNEKTRMRHQISRTKDGIESGPLKIFGSLDMVHCFIDPRNGNARYLLSCPEGCGYKHRDLARHLQSKIHCYDKVIYFIL